VCWECGSGEKKKVSQHFTLGDPKLIADLLGGGKFRPLPGTAAPSWAAAAPPAADPPAPPAADPPAPAAPEPPKKGRTLLG